MSRIGKLPIKIPEGVKVNIASDTITVEGKFGKLMQRYEPEYVTIALEDGALRVGRTGDEKEHKARHGLYRSLINNMIKGVQEPYSKTLQIVGLGYRVQLQGNELNLRLGFSQPIKFAVPEGITIEIGEKGSITVKGHSIDMVPLVIKGADKQLVGQVAAQIRALKKVEPYTGTGIRYKDEHIVYKEGKLAGAAEKAA